MSNGSLNNSDEETKGFLEDDVTDSDFGANISRVQKRTWPTIVIVLNTIWFLFSSSIFGVWYYHQHVQLNGALRRVSSYSPIYDMLDLDISTKKVRGTLFPQFGGSIARQLPNKEADELWDEWELARVIPVTKADLVAMDADIEIAVKLEDELWGLGDDAYAATFDVYHQIHCLNSLRRIIYTSYYNEPRVTAFNLTIREIHVNHCVDILLQALQCNGNVDLMPLEWRQTQRWPFPQMSVNKKCINFDKLTKFRKERGIDMDKYLAYYSTTRPESLVQGPPPLGWVEFYGEDALNEWLTKFPEGHNASSISP
ncbi:hypothetical protein BX600DRAFT_514356 [Xylariales sp. PMI_506]|nr:hypothetical protein BX600DRAFT_514356 [Xylariales sp. PMI_506]